ncbi:hypothetical protein MNBD_NITROSPINAE03-590, partial [hydrothermal vent metagenome]
MKSSNRILPALALILFLASPSALWSAPKTPPAPASYNELISEEWMNILFNNQKIGFSYQKIEKGARGYRITDRAVIKMKIMDISQDMSFANTTYLSGAKKLVKFIYLQTIQSQRQRTTGVMKNGNLQLAITGAGGTSYKTVKIQPDTYFGESIGFALSDKLKVGFKITVPIFIAALRATDNLTFEVVGEKKMTVGKKPVDVYIVESSIQGVKTRSYVTKSGVTIREESFMNFVSVRVSESEALKFKEAYVPITSLITFSLITPDKQIENPAQIKTLKLSIGGLKTPGLLPNDYRQSIGKPKRKMDKSRRRSFTAPVTIKKINPAKFLSIAEASSAMPADLRPSPEIQSDNKMIISVARKIIGGEKDAWQAARKINGWVYKNVEKKLVDSFTAIDVLLSKQGECQSHTNLFTAFARSVGVPARVASGLVYSEKNEGFL